MLSDMCFYQYIFLVFGLPFHFFNGIFQRAEVLNFIENVINLPVIKFYQFILFFFNQSSILCTSVYTCQSQSPNSAHHHPHPTAVFPLWCPYVCSLHLCLNFCPANRFICTIYFFSPNSGISLMSNLTFINFPWKKFYFISTNATFHLILPLFCCIIL